VSVDRALLIAAGAIAALALLPPLPRPRRRVRRRRAEPSRPAGLRAMERHVDLAVASAADLHSRLCPVLRDIARDRLAGAGIDLDADPAAAAAALGEETWAIVRPDREAPHDRHAPGISPERLRAVVEALERTGAAP
jgi:hypothetical protein